MEGELNLPSNFSLENNGEIYGEKLIANSDAVATNNNIMKFTTISLTNTTVNNACSMEATTSFYANGATFNFTQGYLKAPKMEFVNGTVNLSDGSMLDATTSISIPPGYAKFYGKGENTSMINHRLSPDKVSHMMEIWLLNVIATLKRTNGGKTSMY